MSLFSASKGFEVAITDNGYILEWKDDDKIDYSTRFDSGPASIRKKRRDRGIEVHKTKAELMKRVKELI